MKLGYLITGFGLLLCGAFLDSSRAPILPVLSHHFGVNYQQVSLFLVVGYFTSVLSTSLLIPICRRIGAKRAALIACTIAVIMGLFAQTVSSFPLALVLGVLIACSSSSLGAMSNVFVLKGTDPANRGRFMAGLHTMYGLGAQAGPLGVAWALSQNFSWHSVFTMGSVPVLLLAVMIVKMVPSDNRKPLVGMAEEKKEEPPFYWISMGGLVVLMASFYVAAEVLTSNWMVTYLVETRGYSVESAAIYLAGYFWAIAITRAICFLIHSPRYEGVLMWGSLTVALCFFLAGLAGHTFCFALTGLLGPFFPLMLSRMSHYIPEHAESVSIRVMAGMQLTLAVCNLSAGTLIDQIGSSRTYYLPAAFLGGTLALTVVFLRLRPQNRLVSAFV